MTLEEEQVLFMASVAACTAGLLSDHDAGRVIDMLARVKLDLVSAESATEMYDCVVANVKRNRTKISADHYRSWGVIADRLATHVQRRDDPQLQKRRHVVKR